MELYASSFVAMDGLHFVHCKGAEDPLQGGTVTDCRAQEELHVLRPRLPLSWAQAIKRLYPQADFRLRPATENGFFYDVDLGDTKLTDEDLAAIEKR